MSHNGRARASTFMTVLDSMDAMPRWLLAGLCYAVIATAQPSSYQSVATIRQGLPGGSSNTHYAGNRPPLAESPLVKLPPGAVTPRGWLRGQLVRMAGGFSGHLTEISHFCRFQGNAWTSPNGSGTFGWEEVPYWLKGYIDLGYVLGDQRIIAESAKWVEAVLASQQPDGYFGSRDNLQGLHTLGNLKALDLWPNMVMLYPLRTYYEATGDRRVIGFMTKYFHWFQTLPLDRILPASWQKWRAGDQLDSIYWLYNRTGEAGLLDAARVTHERTADWVGSIPTWHGVNLSQCFREPAEYYQQTKDPRYVRATERVYDTFMGTYGQVPGGLFGADENAREGYTGPRQGTETCTMVEMMHSHEMLAAITGDARWIDRAEVVAYNSLPAAMTPDLKGLHYLTAPNMVQLDRASKAPMIENSGDMLSYNPWQYRCCQHNVAFGWPYMAERLWMATRGNGLAAVFYVPSEVKAMVGGGLPVTIQETTDYPFGDSIEMKISVARSVHFPLALRIPGWCAKPEIRVNGSSLAAVKPATGWVRIERSWSDGDTVHLKLPMEAKVRRWPTQGNAASVEYGPLTFSLKIGERWQRYGDSPTWPAYEVFATTPWNYALVLDETPLRVERTGSSIPDQPFTPDSAPVQLVMKGRRLPDWHLEANGLIREIPPSPFSTSAAAEEITLIPMGCARLRISMFPVAARP
jgi:hypothetical protein